MQRRFTRGDATDGECYELSVATSYDGDVRLEQTWQSRRAGKLVDLRMDDEMHPSGYAAQQRAGALVAEQIAAGFRPEPPPTAAKAEDDDDDAEGGSPEGRFTPVRLRVLFDHRAPGEANAPATPHSCGRRDVARFHAAETFPGCSRLPVHMLSIDLGAVDAFPPAVRALGTVHVVYSNHEECDAWMMQGGDGLDSAMHFELLADGRIAPVEAQRYATSCAPEASGEASGNGHEEGSEKAVGVGNDPTSRGRPWGVHLVSEEELLVDSPIRIGGEPEWWQGVEWLDCRGCSEPMFFVATMRAIRVPPDDGCGDQLLNVFVCEACRRVGVGMQMT